MNWINIKEKTPCDNPKEWMIITDGKRIWVASHYFFAKYSIDPFSHKYSIVIFVLLLFACSLGVDRLQFSLL